MNIEIIVLWVIAVLSIIFILFTDPKQPQKQTAVSGVVITVIDNKGFATLENKPVNNLGKQ